MKALRAPGLAGYSRRQIEELEEHAKTYGAAGLAWILEGGVSRFYQAQQAEIQGWGRKRATCWCWWRRPWRCLHGPGRRAHGAGPAPGAGRGGRLPSLLRDRLPAVRLEPEATLGRRAPHVLEPAGAVPRPPRTGSGRGARLYDAVISPSCNARIRDPGHLGGGSRTVLGIFKKAVSSAATTVKALRAPGLAGYSRRRSTGSLRWRNTPRPTAPPENDEQDQALYAPGVDEVRRERAGERRITLLPSATGRNPRCRGDGSGRPAGAAQTRFRRRPGAPPARRWAPYAASWPGARGWPRRAPSVPAS